MKFSHIMGAFVVVVFAAIVVVRINEVSGPELAAVSRCTGFRGDAANAHWDRCATPTTLGIHCSPFVDNVICRCLRDGVEGRSFTAVAPPLADREGAERVWVAQCR